MKLLPTPGGVTDPGIPDALASAHRSAALTSGGVTDPGIPDAHRSPA